MNRNKNKKKDRCDVKPLAFSKNPSVKAISPRNLFAELCRLSEVDSFTVCVPTFTLGSFGKQGNKTAFAKLDTENATNPIHHAPIHRGSCLEISGTLSEGIRSKSTQYDKLQPPRKKPSPTPITVELVPTAKCDQFKENIIQSEII